MGDVPHHWFVPRRTLLASIVARFGSLRCFVLVDFCISLKDVALCLAKFDRLP
jgi:hypothetical protein